MQLVTCCSFKGGAGKTTALMGLCSALAAEGKTIALFEGDENRPLSKWKENATRRNAWDPLCEIFITDELPLLEVAYEEAAGRGFDYCLVETHHGSSELNNTVIASSNLLLIPTMLTPLDADEALATFRYIIELLIGENLAIPAAILRQRVPANRLNSSERLISEMLSTLPLADTPMHERDAFAAMKDRGMLHLNLRNAAANSSMRLTLRNLEAAMEDLRSLGKFVSSTVEH
ncbi:conjugal transfer ATPase VirC1 [Rhizobium leguminosarum bv. viciae]|uniref:conjugal transfer ATPase VirC1 n=1 Tax=Rhizobium TaxID=379 RepID=UPI00098EA602|nr:MULTISPECIES: conjugal transfer ATPase VirC1 [Rhizobium]MBB4346187.1 cellulose biosynthesis protein BcsQ [Rhizobium leguminosarum]MBB5262816.1 cellulose biosynthesis protein BcsQ [Rhizobium leguminosarum]MBB6299317.1 cellulose biosynthesis protein BcsQ [Rhizobium leguminosarum]MBY5345735.1 conjugal transfer ATPase VirC1 [Rhizobium leguminosarum]MBY5482660.1 conjugal transfer ATPase VirC1 [Rhizobium leguminosarum]